MPNLLEEWDIKNRAGTRRTVLVDVRDVNGSDTDLWGYLMLIAFSKKRLGVLNYPIGTSHNSVVVGSSPTRPTKYRAILNPWIRNQVSVGKLQPRQTG